LRVLTTTEYQDINLMDGTTYSYRLRARNVFGFSDYSNTVEVTTPKDTRVKARFIQGMDGYDGTVDLEIRSSSPDSVFDGADTMTVDMNDGGIVHGLLRFRNIFGSNDGQVPPDAEIEKAEIRIYTTGSTGEDISFYTMLTDWPVSCTWNMLGGDGISPDGSEASSSPVFVLESPSRGQYHYVDVTESVKAVQQGAGNYGWGMINSGTDGWDFATSENSIQEHRPMLTVYYRLSGDLNRDGKIDRADVRIIRRYLRKDLSQCPECDMDGDGRITVMDARKIVLRCTYPRCMSSKP